MAVFAIAVLFPGSGTVLGQPGNSTVHTGAPPAWVEIIEPDPTAAPQSNQEAGGQVFNLIDTQVNAGSEETYFHFVKEITTQTGVQSGANLEFNWDPSFQELVIHRIIVQRGTERMDRLDPSRFRIIQQETDLNRQIYNGALSAVLFLEDVRVGDRIEYDYTLRGRNPSLNGRYSDTSLMGWPMPVVWQRFRLLWPEGRQLNFALHGASFEPEVRHHDGVNEYIWDVHQEPAVVPEDQSPSWISPYPWLQLSEFTNWSDVAAWATGLFITTNLDAPALQQEISSLKQPGLTPEQTVQEALEFVQNNVRYLGIEFGPNSYRPTDPAMVLQHRFGDCKDKAYLLCTLLQGLGYDASPVLVATEFRRTLPDLLPAPLDFDHAIVRVVAGGSTYWLDPTRSYQHGPITQRYRPSYSFGLLVKAGVTNLIPIPTSDAGVAFTVTREIFQVGGQKSPTTLNVTSTFNGFDAEWMRAVLEIQGREQVAKSYLNDYAQRYPGATPAKPMVVEDSPDSDTLTIIGNYTITNFWILSADKQSYDCQFYPQGIHSWIEKPMTTIRSMPMELAFPRMRRVETRIELPRPFNLSNFTNTIEGPAARLHVERTYQGQTIWLKYEYRALTNFVPVSLVARHLASLDQMESALGYSLKWQNMDGVGTTSQFNWPIFLLAMIYSMVFAGGTGVLCRRQSRRTRELAGGPPPLLDRNPSGLGGWLILPCLGLIVGPIHLMITMGESMGAFSLWKWHALTAFGGVSYNPLWGPTLIFELLGQIFHPDFRRFCARALFPEASFVSALVHCPFGLKRDSCVWRHDWRAFSGCLNACVHGNPGTKHRRCCCWLRHMDPIYAHFQTSQNDFRQIGDVEIDGWRKPPDNGKFDK